MIHRLVDAGDPDVLRALWPPRDVTWMVAGLTYGPTARLLSVSRTPHGGASVERLSLRYDVRDAEGERRAWRALREAVRAKQPSPLMAAKRWWSSGAVIAVTELRRDRVLT